MEQLFLCSFDSPLIFFPYRLLYFSINLPPTAGYHLFSPQRRKVDADDVQL
jgi:hypothetical protein